MLIRPRPPKAGDPYLTSYTGGRFCAKLVVHIRPEEPMSRPVVMWHCHITTGLDIGSSGRMWTTSLAQNRPPVYDVRYGSPALGGRGRINIYSRSLMEKESIEIRIQVRRGNIQDGDSDT